MRDIFNSVTSVNNANEIGREIDALLKVGGFYLQGWSISSHESSGYCEALRKLSVPCKVDK